MHKLQITLTCRIDACPGSHLIEGSKWLERSVEAACVDDVAVDRFRKGIARRFHLKIVGAWITATLGEALKPFLDHVRELARNGTARFGSGLLIETLAYSDRAEWYLLAPKLEFNGRNRKSGASELLSQPWAVYGSSRFREAVESARLRGLLFGPPTHEPIPGDPRAWYTCLPGALAGRGLDHPWAPPYEPPVIEGNGRIGADIARNDTAAIDRLDPDVAELCAMFPIGGLNIKSYPRLWAASLPETDFAGLVNVAGTRQWQCGEVCARRSAVDILLAAGVLETGILEPIDIVTTRDEARVPILDEVIGPLPESLTATVAGRRSIEVIENALKPKDRGGRSGVLVVPPSWRGEDRVGLGEIRAAASRLGVTVPHVWVRFLSEVGMVDLWGCSPYHPSHWKDTQPDDDDLRAADEILPSRMLAIGSAPNGDWYSLDLDHVTEGGDCPMLEFDHEVNQCVDRWPSVAQIINEVLEDPPGSRSHASPGGP